MTIYVKRDGRGDLIAIGRAGPGGEAPGGEGWCAARDDDPDVLAFGRALVGASNPMAPSDLGLVRVIEDLVDLLIDRAVIRFTDLPPAAQLKLMERRGAREAMQRLSLLDDDAVI